MQYYFFYQKGIDKDIYCMEEAVFVPQPLGQAVGNKLYREFFGD
jgi:hypothetical protein